MISETSRRALLMGFGGALLGARLDNEFFAMDTAMTVRLGSPIDPAVIQETAALGYRGVGPVAYDPATWGYLVRTLIPLLDASRLKLQAVYSRIDVRRDGYTLDPGIREHIAALKGRGTILWLPVSSKDFKPSDRAGDEIAVAAVREAADLAREYGLAVSLYPHFGNLVESVEDAVRIADATGRANAKLTFNLCHWLRVDGAETQTRVLKAAMPRLSLVTINGADRAGKSWDRLIQPLDRGDFDLRAFLKELSGLGYRGPVGLQGYDVARRMSIEPAENLRRSMAAWNQLRREL